MRVQTPICTRLYADQMEVWRELCADTTDAEMLRTVIAYYCQQHNIAFPEYDTHGRGGVRRGEKAVEATPRN